MTAFKYLNRIITATYNDWMEVVAKLRKDRKKWAWIPRIRRREGANVWKSGIFFKEVVQ